MRQTFAKRSTGLNPWGSSPIYISQKRFTRIEENALLPQRRYPREIMIEQDYNNIRTEIVALLHAARTASARSVNALMTASYWSIGRRLVQFEQQGEERAEYGGALVSQLADDLTRQFGRGFSQPNLWKMRAFYLAWPDKKDSLDSVERIFKVIFFQRFSFTAVRH
jgi:hypothetical protein